MAYIGLDGINYKERAVASSEDRNAWLEARNNGVTATNASKLVSIDSIESILKSKFFDGFTGNAATEWGLEREPFLVAWSGFENNKHLYSSAEEPRFMATPDGIRFGSGDCEGVLELCQVKTTGKPMKKIPAHYIRQVQWEMFVMGAARCYFVVEEHENFVPVNLEPTLTIIERDDEVIASLKPLAHALLRRLDDAKAFEKEME
jgi:hypothetical protein